MRKIFFAVAIAALALPIGAQAITFDSCVLFPWQCTDVKEPVVIPEAQIEVQPIQVISPQVIVPDIDIPEEIEEGLIDVMQNGEGNGVLEVEEPGEPAGEDSGGLQIVEPSLGVILGLQEEANAGDEAEEVFVPEWMAEFEGSLFGLGVFFGDEDAGEEAADEGDAGDAEEAAGEDGDASEDGEEITQEQLDQMEDLLENYLQQLENRLDELSTDTSPSEEEDAESDLIEDRLDLVGKYLERIQVVQDEAEEEGEEGMESSLKYILIGVIAVLVIALAVLGVVLFSRSRKSDVK